MARLHLPGAVRLAAIRRPEANPAAAGHDLHWRAAWEAVTLTEPLEEVLRTRLSPLHNNGRLRRSGLLWESPTPKPAGRRFQDFRVVRQAIDQSLALDAAEPGDLELQARIQVVDHPIEASADKPANARDQRAVENRPKRQRRAGNHEPKWTGDDIGSSHATPKDPMGQFPCMRKSGTLHQFARRTK